MPAGSLRPMEQLPLEIRLADHALFANFHPAGNELLVHELRQCIDTPEHPMVWLWGAVQSGRSHLLQACAAEAGERGLTAAYLPLARAGEFPVAALEGLGEMDLVCLDDVDGLAGDPAWERGLFGLYEGLRQGGGRLVVAADVPPAELAFDLPDLASRLKSGGVFRLHALADEACVQALQIRARFRGLELPDDTAHFLLARLPRSMAGLFAVLDQLDRAALAAQRRLTIPFVRLVLDC